MVLIHTNIHSGSPFCGDHQVFQFLKLEALSGHSTHCVVQHLASGVSVLDLVSSEGDEEGHWILCKVDRRNKIRGST